jgi:uncharacterized HAD superfamily protein
VLKIINIVVDLDNTLLDATTPHLKYYNQVSGRNFTEADVNDFYLYRLYDWDQEEREKIYYQFGYNIHWESIPYSMAIDTLNQLSRQHQVSIMTARPMKFHQVTVEWLEHHKVSYHNIVFTENKFQECTNLEADVLIDDAPHYAIEFSQNYRPVILFQQPYNSFINRDYIYRATNWLEVRTHVEHLEKLLKNKERTVE